MLQVGWQDNRLVASFSWQLNSQIPCVEGDEAEFQTFGEKVLLSKRVETVDCISEGTCILDMVPREGCQACFLDCQPSLLRILLEALTAQRGNGRVDRFDQNTFAVNLSIQSVRRKAGHSIVLYLFAGLGVQ